MTKVTKEVIRGTHFFIPKEHAEALHKQAQLYVEHTNNIMYRILPYYQNILENYKDVSLTSTGVIVKNVDDAFADTLYTRIQAIMANPKSATSMKLAKNGWFGEIMSQADMMKTYEQAYDDTINLMK